MTDRGEEIAIGVIVGIAYWGALISGIVWLVCR